MAKIKTPQDKAKDNERRKKQRANETPEARAERLAKEKERRENQRANETPEARSERLAKEKERREKQRANETPEAKAERLAKDNERRKQREAKETPEERQSRYEKNQEKRKDPATKEKQKECAKKWYQETKKNESPKLRREKLDKRKEQRLKRLAKESPAEQQKRKAKESVNRRQYRERVVGPSGLTIMEILNQKKVQQYHEMTANETADEKAERLAKLSEHLKKRRKNETSTQRAARLAKACEERQKPGNKEKRAQKHQTLISNLTPDEKVERLEKINEQQRQRRGKETDDDREKRLANARESYKNLPPEKKEHIRFISRLRYLKNREKQCECTRIWRENNPEKVKMQKERYKQKAKEKWLKMTEEEKQIIRDLQKQRRKQMCKRKGFCDMSKKVVRQKRKAMQKIGMQKLQPLTDEERKAIEKETKDGSLGNSWRQQRVGLCTATRVHRIVVNKWADLSKLAQSMTLKSGTGWQSVYMQLGIKLEKTAVTQYMEIEGIPLDDYKYPVGLTIHPEMPYIGCTPDAITGDRICEFKYSSTPINLGKCYLEEVDEQRRAGRFIQGSPEDSPLYRLSRSSNHFHQIVTQMICTNANHGTIVVYYDKTSNPEEWEFWIDHISREEAKRAWRIMEPRIQDFYRNYFVPKDKWELIKPSTLCARLTGTASDDDDGDDEYVYDDADDDYESEEEDDYEDIVNDVVDYVLDEKSVKKKITTIGKVVTRAASKAFGSVSTLQNRLTRKVSKSDSEFDDDSKYDEDYTPGESVKKNVKKVLQRGGKFLTNVASNTCTAVVTGYDFFTGSQSFATPSTSVEPSNVKRSDSYVSNYGQAHPGTSSFKRLPVETPKQTYKRQAKITQIQPTVQSNSLYELLNPDSNRQPNQFIASMEAAYTIGRQSDRSSLMTNASIHNPPAYTPMTNLLVQNPPTQRYRNSTSQVNFQPSFIHSDQNRVVTEVVDKPVDNKEPEPHVVEDVKIKQRTSNRNRKPVMEY